MWLLLIGRTRQAVGTISAKRVDNQKAQRCLAVVGNAGIVHTLQHVCLPNYVLPLLLWK